MYLIVGLGNPGPKYANTRHNLGFQVIESLSRKLETGKPVQKHKALLAETTFKGEKVVLAQPLTYMNLSGHSVKEMIGNYHTALSDLLIIYDDLDLPPGVIRLRGSGGSGGHRGLQSIIDALGTNAFPRLRIGIGPSPEWMETADYVLLHPQGDEKDLLNDSLLRSTEAVLSFITDGLEQAMNLFNREL